MSFDRARFVEPVNTCLKAVVQCDPQPGDCVVVMGQGPIGLMFTSLVNRSGARVLATDTIPSARGSVRPVVAPRKHGIREAPM